MKRTALALTAATVLTLTGCGTAATSSSSQEAAAHFPAPQGQLVVRNEFGRVDVKEADTDEVTVVRHVMAIGKKPDAPDWSMEGDTLHLKSACGRGYVGVCEPTFTLTVPRGTKVTVTPE